MCCAPHGRPSRRRGRLTRLERAPRAARRLERLQRGAVGLDRRGRREVRRPPLLCERRPARLLRRILADGEEEEDGRLEPRERLGAERLRLELREHQPSPLVARRRARQRREVLREEGAHVVRRHLAGGAEEFEEIVAAIVGARQLKVDEAYAAVAAVGGGRLVHHHVARLEIAVPHHYRQLERVEARTHPRHLAPHRRGVDERRRRVGRRVR
mmetsp:Transcript_44679/g.148111  ORF Transcript_44679/g.148111 Transcript_44679/m.148111 type:complete len:213 (-) Transcript_44679:683-1321(-)